MNTQFLSARRLIAICGIGAVAVAGLVVLMSRDGGAQSQGTPSSPDQPSASQRLLEFDLPGDASGVTAFIVGYFASGQKAPAFSFEVPRSRVQSTKSGVFRIPLIVGPLPPGQTYTIRLRTVAGDRQSAWSAPSGTFTVASDAATPADPAGTPVKAPASDIRRPSRSAASELERDPELQKRLTAAFPGLDVSKAAAGFRSVPDLAAALFASKNVGVPFDEIKKLAAEGGNRNLQQAITALKPGADARAETRRARSQARKLLRQPRK